ncbi:MAG: hypothetical protein KAQ62_27770 [Cyclobacteriaceae bacterium]|nr:hypothetical protein [Cyclobacteriaceae bacterium]
MEKKIIFLLIFNLLVTISFQAYGQNDTLVWKEFVISLKEGQITREKIRPYFESLTDPILQFLYTFREEAVWEEWDNPSEIHRINEKVHFLIPLCWGSDNCNNFCFSFITENNDWYFHHMENVNIRLDTINSFPTSDFTKLPDETLHWIRAEYNWTLIVRIYNFLKEEKGTDFALDWLNDGIGYYLAAKVWVPFIEPEKAFILYACFDLSVVRGNEISLQKLDDNEAIITWKPNYLALYEVSGHIRTQISIEEYKRIFEKIWHERANAAGWILEIDYLNDQECKFFFKKD